jgi:hypothetical protein
MYSCEDSPIIWCVYCKPLSIPGWVYLALNSFFKKLSNLNIISLSKFAQGQTYPSESNKDFSMPHSINNSAKTNWKKEES